MGEDKSVAPPAPPRDRGPTFSHFLPHDSRLEVEGGTWLAQRELEHWVHHHRVGSYCGINRSKGSDRGFFLVITCPETGFVPTHC